MSFAQHIIRTMTGQSRPMTRDEVMHAPRRVGWYYRIAAAAPDDPDYIGDEWKALTRDGWLRFDFMGRIRANPGLTEPEAWEKLGEPGYRLSVAARVAFREQFLMVSRERHERHEWTVTHPSTGAKFTTTAERYATQTAQRYADQFQQTVPLYRSSLLHRYIDPESPPAAPVKDGPKRRRTNPHPVPRSRRCRCEYCNPANHVKTPLPDEGEDAVDSIWTDPLTQAEQDAIEAYEAHEFPPLDYDEWYDWRPRYEGY